LTSKEQYIHRLGRTARAGKKGDGLLMLIDFEQDAMMSKELKGLPITPCKQQGQVAQLCQTVSSSGPYQQAIAAASNPNHPLHQTAMQGYQAWLGFYNSNMKKLRWSPRDLVMHANAMAACWGYPDRPPALQKKTVGKMGLKGVPGLNTY
jgi:ATP-dependent RNA helicase MSS116, mitochondrial